MKYIAYIEQFGDRHSIGHGQIFLWLLEAQNHTDAVEEPRNRVIGDFSPEYIRYDGGYWDEEGLKRVILFEVATETEMPIEQWYSEAEEHAKNYEATAKEKAEREEYERLKEKFGL